MPIVSKTPGIRVAGKYPCMVAEISKDPSKAGNPMLTLQWNTLSTPTQGVRQWLVMSNSYGPKEFAEVKMALGLPATAKGEDLLGCKAMLTLALDPPKDDGKVYTRVIKVEPLVAGQASTNATPAALDF